MMTGTHRIDRRTSLELLRQNHPEIKAADIKVGLQLELAVWSSHIYLVIVSDRVLNPDCAFTILHPHSPTIVCREDAVVGVLAHEVLHATISLLSDKQVKLSDDSEEAYAYTLGFMMQSIYDFIVKFRKRRKKKHESKKRKS